MKKKLGLCSPCVALTIEAANALNVASGAEYLIFSETIQDYITKNLGQKTLKNSSSNMTAENFANEKNLRIPAKYKVVKDIILPAINFMKETGKETPVVVFDMETIIHDEATDVLKKDYRLCYLKFSREFAEGRLEFMERTLFKEYCDKLEIVCDNIVDLDKYGFQESIQQLSKMI